MSFLLAALLVGVAYASPVGTVAEPDSRLPGAFRAVFSDGSEIRVRDVFIVQRGGKDLGRAVVVRMQGTVVTMAARPGFNGAMKPGDRLRYLYREPEVPPQASTRVQLPTREVAIVGQPGQYAGNFRVTIVVTNPGAFRARRIRVRCELVDFFGRVVLTDTASVPDLAPNARARVILFARRRDVALLSSIGDRATILVRRGRTADRRDVQTRLSVEATP